MMYVFSLFFDLESSLFCYGTEVGGRKKEIVPRMQTEKQEQRLYYLETQGKPEGTNTSTTVFLILTVL